MLKKWRKQARLLVQVGFAVLTNGNLKGFLSGRIYQGPLKKVCVPGLNCYSCPGALGACPIGSLQAVEAARKFHFSYYVVGLLVLYGALLGRFICGWLCPFGLVQDLLYKIPFFRKLRTLPGEKYLRGIRYGMLAVLVVALPVFAANAYGLGTPWFCKYVCPSGTLLGGIPLALGNPAIRAGIGGLYWWKIALLAAIVVLSLPVWRPFCRYLCPLGAIYGLFNPVSAVRLQVNSEQCISCGACRRACKMDLNPEKNPNSFACVRCGDCKAACPVRAISWKTPWTKGKATGETIEKREAHML